MTSRTAARIAAPVAFLLAVTIAVLLVRSGLQEGGAETPPRTPPSVSTRSVVVRPGDTLEAIALAAGVTVAELRRLNPAVDPVELRVGQRIRVR